MNLPAGTTLAGRYTVLSRLGEGGMGSVYKVEERGHPGVYLAAKELLDDATATPDDVAWANKRFDDEIALMRELHHPRIPAFHASFNDGGRRFFVMDYIPGENLEQRLEHAHAPLPEADTLRWMSAICDVLIYLHGHRPPIIIRDLKPGNIMVTPDGDARLIDFGIARTYKQGQRTNTENLGTMTYASPEHLGKTQTDARSDIYSFGATMYHLLTNHEPTPLQTPPPGDLRRYHPSLSEATEALVIKAMQINPAQRFQTALALADALKRCQRALPKPPRSSVGVSQAQPSRAAGSARNAPALIRPAATAASASTAAPGPAPALASNPAPAVARPSPVQSSPASTSQAAAPLTSLGRVCPRCGFPNRADAKFCANDGTPLQAGAASFAVAPRSNAPSANHTGAGVYQPSGSTVTTAELHANRATASLAAGRYTQAITQGEAAIAEGRATYDMYWTLGQAYRALGRAADAAQAFAHAAALRPNAEALLAEGLAWREANDLTQAQIALSRARQHDPRDADIPYQLGLVCLALGHLAQAEGELIEAQRLRPDHVPTLVALGSCYTAQGYTQQSRSTLQQALALAPHDAEAQRLLQRLP